MNRNDKWLSENEQKEFGFKGGQSLRHYIHHNTDLLEYIDSVFRW